MEEIVREAKLERNPCPLIGMFIFPQKMMGILLKIVIQGEISQVLVISEIKYNHQEDYTYCDYGHSSSHDDYPSRGCSIRDDYGPDLNYLDHTSGSSYGD